MEIKIIHFYPDLMSLYGSYANVSVLKRRLEQMGSTVTVTPVLPGQGGDHGKGVIRGAVVHQDDLIVIFRQRGHGAADLHHAADGVGGMVAGDNERNQLHLPFPSSLRIAMKITSLYSPSSFTMWRKMPSVMKPAFS